MPAFPKVVLKKGKERPVLRGHPWIFSGAVEKIEGEFAPGDVGAVYSREGQFLGLGHLNPHSQIVLRLLTRKKEPLNEGFFRERIAWASRWREHWFRGKTNACRLVNGEGDFLPGLIVDRYGEVLVVQCLTVGMDRLKRVLVEILVKEHRPQSVYERSDVATRKEEGLQESKGLLYGKEHMETVRVEEDGARFLVDVASGQKTGFYLDQRENRILLRHLSEGLSVLDVCSYTGGFSIHAGLGRAKEVTLVDSSEEALRRAEEHFTMNQLDRLPHRMIQGDAFEVLRHMDSRYDLIILDPPPFAKKKGHVSSASRGYKELNLQAFRRLNAGGLLLTFSCSHHLSADLFQKILFGAAVDAGKDVQFINRRGHPADHPVSLFHPEGEYLKGFICRSL